MRPLLITLLTLCLLGASTGSIVAQSAASSPEPVGQLVEAPETGFAIVLPIDWAVRTSAEDPELGFIVITGPERFGPDVRMEPVMAAEPQGQAPGSGFPDACTLTLYRPIMLTPDEFLGELFGKADDITVESLRDDLSRALHRPWSSVQRQHAFYAIGGEAAVAILWCWAVEPPEDYWLSIAESFEFLPVEE